MNGISLQFAGSRGDAAELARRIDTMLAAAAAPPRDEPPLALVSPHAGYVYSGPIAAFAYRAVQGQTYDTVVVIGPSHRDAFTGLSVYDTTRFDTPLGQIPCDRELIGRLVGAHPNIGYRPSAHRDEHSLEVQVPFLQRALAGFKIVMVVAGGRDPEADLALVDALVAYAAQKRVLVVASSDLSHYHGYAEANSSTRSPGVDRGARHPTLIRDIGRALRGCGIPGAADGYAWRIPRARRCWRIPATPRAQGPVVGYAALVLWRDGAGRGERAPRRGEDRGNGRPTGARAELLGIARRRSRRRCAVAARDEVGEPGAADAAGGLQRSRSGQLRGCIGTSARNTPLYRTVADGGGASRGPALCR
jgi:hypothetical protein